jgi:hypothetical protein
MDRLDVVGMIVPPCPSHAAGTDVVRNDVVIIRKLDLQRAQAPFCATIFLSISFRISALGWRFCAWQLVREGPGSEISRALAACLDSEAGRRILAKDLARADIATQSRNRLATRLAHDDELPHAVHCGLVTHPARRECPPSGSTLIPARPAALFRSLPIESLCRPRRATCP